MTFRRRKSVVRREIDPDEIFLDSKNLPGFDVHQFEGRIERPVSIKTTLILSSVFVLMLCVLLGKAWVLQAQDGAKYQALSSNNILKETTIYANRGAIFDRNGVRLAWNTEDGTNTDFALRSYIDEPGLGHILGYIKYPTKDSSGNYYQKNYVGMDGVEKSYDTELQGTHGTQITQTDAVGHIESQSVVQPAVDGQNLTLSIDSTIQTQMYDQIKSLADRVGFAGGAGMIMDVHTGEVLALTSYPEYSSQVMSDGKDSSLISSYLNDPRKPFLDRMIDGLYTPGSIVKPYVAIGALEEHVIDPLTQILSTGSISIPNPYDPTKKSVFVDWRPQGLVDMRHAIAVSSDVYFYEVGGGFQNQPGLGIDKLDEYFNMFGLGVNNETGFFSGPAGTIPSIAWKAKAFPGDPWRVGDTYFTAIGQYGFQVTPLQMVKSLVTIANGGTYIHPTILLDASSTPALGQKIPVNPNDFQIVREGMRLGAQIGTAVGLNVSYLDLAAKTGTAQVGVNNAYDNSWVSGFWPYENPKYAFVVMMEHGPATNTLGGLYVMRGLLDWMHQNNSPYLAS